MRISDVVDQTGIPVSTIRYYEKHAIIPKPARNGRERTFSPQDIQALQFVRDAQSLGLSLGEISDLLQGDWATGEMAKTATAHRQKVRNRIAALKRIDKVLATLETCHCNSFAQCDVKATECKRDD